MLIINRLKIISKKGGEMLAKAKKSRTKFQVIVISIVFAFGATMAGSALMPRKAFATVPPASLWECLADAPTLYIWMGEHSCIAPLQWFLNWHAGQRLAIDGIFGTATRQAVKNLQTWVGLSADGIVGYDTWGVIFTVCWDSGPAIQAKCHTSIGV
jgi:peptidoglycan hydrolase-like protein with peptidoglycan-binding domain